MPKIFDAGRKLLGTKYQEMEHMMEYKIDERVGCIAVVESTYTEECLAADFDGVVALWYGLRGTNGWDVEEWQKEKAARLCALLNSREPLPA